MKTWGEDVEGFSQHLYISKKVQYLFSEGVKSTLYRDHSDRCFGFLTTLMVSMIEDLLIQSVCKEQSLVCKSSKA